MSNWSTIQVGRVLRTTQRVARRYGVDIRRHREFPSDFDPDTRDVHRRVEKFTLVSPERTHALCSSIAYLEHFGIPGDIVECGVWKGGSMMAAAIVLNRLDSHGRDLWLYDTYEGLPAPGEMDVDALGNSASEQMRTRSPNLLPTRQDGQEHFAYASLDDVRRNMGTVAYAAGEVHFVKGLVEQTIPESVPDQIALLRLDTDFYSSTKHELEHLVPRMAPGGVLIVDDYGTWLGAQRAVDEFLAESGLPLYLCRIDTTARLAVVGASGLSTRNGSQGGGA
jgi:hypothetical protein